MREIKYRAWDERFNKWAYGTDNHVEEKKTHSHTYNQGRFFINLREGLFGTEKVYQYTGLKDKKGYEIYESDLGYAFDVKDTPLEIIFRNGSFGYMTGGKYSYFVSIAGNTNISFNGDNCMDIEVIGNIYENPELLEA